MFATDISLRLCPLKLPVLFLKNIASYMADPPPPPTPPPAPSDPQTSSPDSTATTLSPSAVTTAGAKFPPFAKKEVNDFTRNEYNSHGRSKKVLTEEEAKVAKENIWGLLHDFEGCVSSPTLRVI